jgi:hypothetical protein
MWDALRQCWLELESPHLQVFAETDFSVELRRQHASTVDALVASGKLDPAVANELRAAFEQAMAHMQRLMVMCYAMLPPEFFPRQDLLDQATALEEMARQSDIPPDTVTRAQAALARDIAWLTQFHVGQAPGPLDSIAMDQLSAEAAHVLIELLLGRQEE